MEIMVAKGVVLGILFLLTFMFSMLPIKLVWSFRHTIDPVRRFRMGQMISLMSCFAGGVFMGTGLLDLFPEVNETLTKAMVGYKSSFPVAEFTVAFGFFLVLIVEQVVLDFKETSDSLPIQNDILSSNDVSDERRRLRRQGSLEGISDNPLLNSASYQSSVEDVDPHSTLRSFLLLIALSLHSLFEGVAIGLQPNVASVVQIFAAVIIHKVIIAFSLGLNLVQSKLSLGSIIKSNFLFCLMSPLGMGLAMGLEEFGKSVDSSIVNGVLQGLACGTFFYVTFFEVLPHELNHGGQRLLKLFAILLGFSVVCGVLFLEPSADDNNSQSQFHNSIYFHSRRAILR